MPYYCRLSDLSTLSCIDKVIEVQTAIVVLDVLFGWTLRPKYYECIVLAIQNTAYSIQECPIDLNSDSVQSHQVIKLQVLELPECKVSQIDAAVLPGSKHCSCTQLELPCEIKPGWDCSISWKTVIKVHVKPTLTSKSYNLQAICPEMSISVYYREENTRSPVTEKLT